ncbi:MAG: DUF2164 domain-containing protein [Usitatibacteraceae bacterium]
MAIKLPKESEQHLIDSIKKFFSDQLATEIGDLKARLALEFFTKEIGPSVYNQAIADAQEYINERVADLGGARYEPELAYWPDTNKR